MKFFKNRLFTFSKYFSFAATLLLGFLLGIISIYPIASSYAISREAHKYLQIMHEILAYLDTDYVEPVDEAILYKGAIQGILASLKDPHTRFLDKDEFSELQNETKGSFGGLGVEVVFQDGKIIVISPIDDTPASRAGIQPQDKIIEINGNPTSEMTLNEAIQAMRGEVGTSIQLKIERTGVKPFVVELIREKIKIQYLKSEYLPKEKIGYIRLLQFMGRETTVEEFKSTIQTMRNQGAKGIVIDLRNNPGGLMDLAVGIAELFLNPGQEVVSVRGRENKLVKSYKTGKEAGIYKDLPIVILINNGSASASEILAGALKDYNRAKIVGTKSFGKGSVQNIYNLPYDTGVAITIQKYFTPKGTSIHGLGIDPDYLVEPIQPQGEDRFYLEKMNKEKILKSFVEKNPEYSASKAEEFVQLLKKNNINLTPELAKFLYYNETHAGKKRELIQWEFDPQLKKAIQVLTNKE